MRAFTHHWSRSLPTYNAIQITWITHLDGLVSLKFRHMGTVTALTLFQSYVQEKTREMR
jgi:hypothetical protein